MNVNAVGVKGQLDFSEHSQKEAGQTLNFENYSSKHILKIYEKKKRLMLRLEDNRTPYSLQPHTYRTQDSI